MFCKKCGNEISDGATFCPKCGNALKSTDLKSPDQAKQPNPYMMPISELGMGNMSQTTTGTSGDKAASNVIENILKKSREMLGGIGASGSDKQSGNNKNGVLIAIGAAAAVVLVLIVANGTRVNNFVHKTFSSPEKYYQFVEKKTIKELSDYSGEWYDNYVLDSLNFFDRSVNGELTVKLGKDGQEYLELLGLAGVDVSWLESVSIGVDTAVKNDTVSSGMSFALNGSDILSYNVKMDTENETAYLQIPEINKTYMGVDLSTIEDYTSSFEPIMQFSESNKKLWQACPDQAEVEKLTKRYMMLALACVDDVSKSKETLKAEGVEQKCTVLKVTIDAETMQDMLEAVLEEMRDDKDVKKLMYSVLEAGSEAVDEDIDVDEIYEEFQDSIDEILGDLDYLRYDDSKIVMKVYVDGKGEIRGRSIDTGYVTVKSLMPERGNKFGYELSYDLSGGYRGMTMKLTGSGKTSGDKISGDFQIKYNGAALVDITVKKFDTKELKAGRPNGRIEVRATSKIGNIIGSVPGLSVIEDAQINIDFNSSKNKYACKVGLVYDKQDIVNMELSVNTGSGSKAAMPSGKNVIMIEDEDDIQEWLDGVDLDGVIASLKKADVPSKITDVLDEIEEIDDIEEAVYRLIRGYYFYY